MLEAYTAGRHSKHSFDGDAMHQLAAELFPICRSITGEGLRKTLRILQREIPLSIERVPSGTQAFDWTVPREWNIRDAYILDPEGNKIVDFRANNLHVLGYSVPVDKTLSLEELDRHLYSRPDRPDAIPYATSYYEERWGFCMAHNQRRRLKRGQYRAVIDSDLSDGELNYGELVIPGESKEEVFISTYVCHPSMANNELSGPVVATALARWVMSAPRRYTYRFVFVPETIGSLAYLSRNLTHLKQHVVAGYNLTCIGDERAYSFLPSRNGNTLSDRAARTVVSFHYPDAISYSFLDRGSDERQYCSPGVDLPIASLMRCKYRTYPEYHTSEDDLRLVTPSGLEGGLLLVKRCLNLIERNSLYTTTCLGEPQLAKYGLMNTVGDAELKPDTAEILNVLAYADGRHDLISICEAAMIAPSRALELVDLLMSSGLVEEQWCHTEEA